MNAPFFPSRRAAFSLIELVVVISIIVLIAGFTIPAASTMLKGSQLTQASQMLVDQLSLARQLALSKNRIVEVRFYRFGDPENPGEDKTKPETGEFRALQLFELLDTNQKAAVPLSKAQRLPTAVIISPGELSSLIDETTAGKPKSAVSDGQAPELPRGVAKNYEYVAFRFLQDGSTNLKATNPWFITLHRAKQNPTETFKGATLPANYFTVQIDPVNGTTRVFRPTAG